jgi:hypothetical protein
MRSCIPATAAAERDLVVNGVEDLVVNGVEKGHENHTLIKHAMVAVRRTLIIMVN